MGGATSTDKLSRKEGLTWWKDEEISYGDIENTLTNLDLNGNIVDMVLSHDGPSRIIKLLEAKEKIILNQELENFLTI